MSTVIDIAAARYVPVVSTARAFGLLLGIAADGAFTDPRRGRPGAAFRAAASRTERLTYRDNRMAGLLHAALLTGSATALGVLAERLGRRHRLLRVGSTAAATWVVLGGTSLANEATAVGRELDAGQLAAARDRMPRLSQRDPDQLDNPGMARATVESVAESTSDAVVAPLLWGATAGVPGLLGYHAVHTLDAMVGHRTREYLRFGWASARLDDLANLVPARVSAGLTALCAPVVGGSARGAWRTWRRDAMAHPSPNAGCVEAAFAGALEVRLGGRTAYRHGVRERPVLGDGRNPDSGHVTRAVELFRVVGAVAGFLAAGLALARR